MADTPEDYISSDIIFPVATNNHQELVAYAVQVLRRYWKGDGKYYYKKAGVIVWVYAGIMKSREICLMRLTGKNSKN